MQCPCYVYFTVPDSYRDNDKMSFRLYGESLEESGDFDAGEIRARTHRDVLVRRGIKAVTCISGYNGENLRQGAYIVPLGEQCDSIFAHRSILYADGDEAVAPMIDDKQFCCITITFAGDDEGGFPFYAVMECSSCGVNLMDCSACEGQYSAKGIPVTPKGNELLFIVPRQQADGAKITVHLHSVENSAPECVFDLAQEIAESGFDWNKASLDDLHITVDQVAGIISISVLEWEHCMKEEIVI